MTYTPIKRSIIKLVSGRDDLQYRGKFHMVQTFAVFADGPTTVKIKTANV